MKMNDRSRFLLRNMLRGLLWLGVLVALFIYAKHKIDVNYLAFLEPVYERPIVVYLIFLFSEVVFGIIPPEIFFIWAARTGELTSYVWSIVFLAVTSYFAGMLGFFIGYRFGLTKFYRLIRMRFLGKYERLLNRFGPFLIIVAALTPVPYSAISMLVGAVKYPFLRYLIYASFRFVRFAAYSYVIWEANKL